MAVHVRLGLRTQFGRQPPVNLRLQILEKKNELLNTLIQKPNWNVANGAEWEGIRRVD